MKDLFSPNMTNLGLNTYRGFFRVKEWTTTGFWMIKTKHEPLFLTRYKESEEKPGVDSVLKDAETIIEQIEPDVECRLLSGEATAPIVRKMKGKDHVTWVNPYYLQLFLNLPFRVSFCQKDTLGRIVVRKEGEEEVVGLIMPCRVEE